MKWLHSKAVRTVCKEILKELWKLGASQHLLCFSEGTDSVSEHDSCLGLHLSYFIAELVE